MRDTAEPPTMDEVPIFPQMISSHHLDEAYDIMERTPYDRASKRTNGHRSRWMFAEYDNEGECPVTISKLSVAFNVVKKNNVVWCSTYLVVDRQ